MRLIGTRFRFFCLVALIVAVVAVVGLYHRISRYDLLITNARIVDGTGGAAFNGDIAVKGNRIVRIGAISPGSATRIIDAAGHVVAPGFIDVHTHVEEISKSPAAENFIRMGVTTVVTGNCGSSAIDVSGFYVINERSRPAVNVTTLIGLNSVRAFVMDSANRDATPDELQLMKTIVEQGMKDGALGLSTGLIYIPGTYAKTDEIISLARVATRYGGIYATHMRDEGIRIEEGIEEAIRVGDEAHIPVEISHFKVTSKKLWNESSRALKLIEEARTRGLSVTVDQYAYTASSTSIDVLLPKWVREEGREGAMRRLADKNTRAGVVREMKKDLHENGFEDYSYAVVASYKPNPSFNGKSVVEITKHVRPKSTLDDQIEQIFGMYGEGGAAMIYHNMSENDVQEIMREPFTLIASDSRVHTPGEDIPHPRGYGNNPRVLGRYVRELGLITLEDAVRKMTSLPAQVFGLRDRGLVREGMAADLVIFDENRIGDTASFAQPRLNPVGISHVIVNGKLVFADGVLSAERPGEMLRRADGPH